MTLAADIRASIKTAKAAAISKRPCRVRQDTSELKISGTLVEQHAVHTISLATTQQRRLSYKQPAIGNNSMGSTSGNQL